MNQLDKKRHLFWHLIYIIPLLLLFISMISMTAIANNMNSSDDSVEILEQTETINGPGFFSGNSVQIDGTVDGTAFVTGGAVHINGTINGSLFVAAQTVIVRGTVTGNIYIAGQHISIAGQNQQDTFLAGETIIVNSQAQIGRDLFTAGSTILIESSLPRHLYGAGRQMTLNGSIGGNAHLESQQISLQESAFIEGNLNYTSQNEAQFHSNSVVDGEITWIEVSESRTRQETNLSRKVIRTLLGMLWSIVSSLLVWLAFKIWRKFFWQRTITPLTASPLKTLGIGLLVLIISPFAVLLSFVTIIGIPLGIILLGLYFLLLYLSHIIAAAFIGFWLAKRLKWRNLQKEIWSVLLGLFILEIVGWIPFLNILITLVVLTAGIGAFVQAYYKTHSNYSF